MTACESVDIGEANIIRVEGGRYFKDQVADQGARS